MAQITVNTSDDGDLTSLFRKRYNQVLDSLLISPRSYDQSVAAVLETYLEKVKVNGEAGTVILNGPRPQASATGWLRVIAADCGLVVHDSRGCSTREETVEQKRENERAERQALQTMFQLRTTEQFDRMKCRMLGLYNAVRILISSDFEESLGRFDIFVRDQLVEIDNNLSRHLRSIEETISNWQSADS